MKRLITVMVVCCAGVLTAAQERDSLLVMFWNVENFFDWTDQGTGDSDRDFSSDGVKRWTKSRFYIKCDAFAKTVIWIGDTYGQVPDVICLAEVENKGVLTRLLSATLLRKFDYDIVHQDSRDRRGIDVALLYRKSSMSLVSSTFVTPSGIATRDILHAEILRSNGDTVDLVVNHHPSKYGGSEESDKMRRNVMETLKNLCDSLLGGGTGKIVAMGDFNDTPDGEQFRMMNDIMDNKGSALHQRGEGTIRYKGKWELIDMFLTGKKTETSEMYVLRAPFLMTYDRTYPGEKPLRTFSGPRYLGGVSDHCPILIWLYGRKIM